LLGHYLSIFLFFVVLGLGFFRPRFWCRYVCPTGAVFSVFNTTRVIERKVEDSCINCNKCVEICPFDAIKADFTTRIPDCTVCQSCGGVCPTDSIKFVERWNVDSLKVENHPETDETPVTRRQFLGTGLASLSLVLGNQYVFGASAIAGSSSCTIRPPGSVPEKQFLELCISCGECFKVCPNNVLQPMGFEKGLEGLWTPQGALDWAGCEPSCNNCGQVCPTGAIRALPIEEKEVARMGLAIVNEVTCLPYAEKEACQLCVDDCAAAGYNALEFIRVGGEVDDNGEPLEDSGFLAPVVLPDKCVGCGLCQMRCNLINVKEKGLLDKSAIIVEAGPDKEDRMMDGSYLDLRKQERLLKQQQQKKSENSSNTYLPDFLK